MSVRFRQLWRSCAERKGKCDSRLFGGDGFAWHWAFANDASTERTEQRFSVRRDSFRRGRARGTPREKIRANLSTRRTFSCRPCSLLSPLVALTKLTDHLALCPPSGACLPRTGRVVALGVRQRSLYRTPSSSAFCAAAAPSASRACAGVWGTLSRHDFPSI